MFINFKYFGYICCILLCASIRSSFAAQWLDNIAFDGFANIGFTYSDNDTLLYRSSILNKGHDGFSVRPDSWVGLQASLDLAEHVDAVGQVILQDRWDQNLSNYLELLFVRYYFDRNTYLKLGRFSTNSYLFTDSRYVSQSYPWARAPIDQYSAVGAVGNMNGAQLGWQGNTRLGLFKGSFSFGENEFNNDRSSPFIMTYRDLAVANIELSTLDWRIQLAHLEATIADLVFGDIESVKQLDILYPGPLKPFAEQIQNGLLADGKNVSYSSIGIHYTFDETELIAEYGKLNSDWALASSTSFSYFSALRTIDDKTLFMIIGETDRKQTPDIIDFELADASLPPSLFNLLNVLVTPLNEYVRANSYDQQSISFGIRWDLASNWSLKAQFDHYRMNPYGSGFFTLPNGQGASGNSQIMNVMNLSFSTTF